MISPVSFESAGITRDVLKKDIRSIVQQKKIYFLNTYFEIGWRFKKFQYVCSTNLYVNDSLNFKNFDCNTQNERGFSVTAETPSLK